MADDAHLGGPRQGAARAGGAVVGVGRLRLADQRDRPRGGRRAAGDVRRDGRVPGVRAVRARRCSTTPRSRSPSPTGSCGSGRSRCSRSPAATQPELRKLGERPGGEHRGRRRAILVSPPASTAPRRERCGRWRSPSTAAGPYFFGQEGWKLVPSHFAERHGLIVIIALGRVDRGDRRRRGGRHHHRRGGRGRARHRRGRRHVVAVLRRRRHRRRAPPDQRGGRATSRTGSRATPTPTCTSRWSPGSCWWRSG